MNVPRSLAVLVVTSLLIPACGYQTSSDADQNSTDGHLLKKDKEKDQEQKGDVEADDDKSLVLEPPWTWKGKTIVNGTAYDKAAIHLKGYHTVVVQEKAVIRRGEAGQKLEIYLAKTLREKGWGVEADIREMRKEMGCCVTPEGKKLVVATYGEWEDKHGWATVGILLVVPKGVQIEERQRLRSKPWDGYLTRPVDAKKGYWHAPAPTDTGKAIRSVPDPERTAGFGK